MPLYINNSWVGYNCYYFGSCFSEVVRAYGLPPLTQQLLQLLFLRQNKLCVGSKSQLSNYSAITTLFSMKKKKEEKIEELNSFKFLVAKD